MVEFWTLLFQIASEVVLFLSSLHEVDDGNYICIVKYNFLVKQFSKQQSKKYAI